MPTPASHGVTRSDRALFDALVGTGRARSAAGGEAELLYERKDSVIVRVGDIVLKAHPEGVRPADLVARVRVAASTPGLLAPLEPPFPVAGRTVTVWPHGTPVTPDVDPPWEEGARLLARLHRHPVPAHAPACRGWARRVARAVGRLPRGTNDAAVAEIRRTHAGLSPWLRSLPEPEAPACLVHGDWHLGQLVHTPNAGWRLIDIGDLGTGDPAWDLARPAALFASGLLPPREWERFLAAYRAAGGPAVPPEGDPWSTLDLPARAMVVQIAATRVGRARAEGRPLNEQEEPLVRICRRIRLSH
ncbi:phosphotransferase family protein [Halostreptopolyspora alba]|uniref:phosphotransferase family protein n=1 Tax=Halostreptopolyspora alba TaxID=2487137 RepID=UPI00371103AF